MKRQISKCALFGVAMVVLQAHAAIELYSSPQAHISFSLEAMLGAMHSQQNYIYGSEARSYSWQEGYIKPGLAVDYALEDAGQLYGNLSYLSSAAWGDGDPAGSSDGSERTTKVEDAALGWRSGDLFPVLGDNGIDLSFGRQQLMLGSGFLVAANGPNLGNSTYGHGYSTGGAFYLGARRAFDEVALLRWGGGSGWHGSLSSFKTDLHVQAKSEFQAATLAYTAAPGTLEFTVLHNSDVDQGLAQRMFSMTGSSSLADREGMNVYGINGSGNFGIEHAHFSFEYAGEDRKQGSYDNAWYIKGGYSFNELPYIPSLSYRYTRYSEKWDPLFNAFTEYGTWFHGEVAGNYSGPFNSNARIHTVQLTMLPTEAITLGAIYYDLKSLHTHEQVDMSGRELDVYVQWMATPNVFITPLLGIYKPNHSSDEGGMQSGSNDRNLYSQLVVGFFF